MTLMRFTTFAAPAILLLLLVAATPAGLFGCSSRGSTADDGQSKATDIELPEIPYEFAALAEFPEVEAYPSANDNFARAYREEQAASSAASEELIRYHLLNALAYRRHGLAMAPGELHEHQRYQNHLAQLGQENPAYIAALIVEYHETWQDDPLDPAACYLLGRAFMLIDQLDAAEQLFNRGLERSPHDYWLNIAKGAIAWHHDDAETALEHLERAAPVGLTSGEMGATRMLGRVYHALGRYDAAAEKLTLVLQIAPQVQIEDFEILAKCLKHLGKFSQAEQMLLQDIPNYIVAGGRNKHMRTVGDLYRHAGRYESALWAYELYLDFQPDAADRDRIEGAIAEVEEKLRGDD